MINPVVFVTEGPDETQVWEFCVSETSSEWSLSNSSGWKIKFGLYRGYKKLILNQSKDNFF